MIVLVILANLCACKILQISIVEMQYFADQPNNLSFGLGKAYWAWAKGKFKPFLFFPFNRKALYVETLQCKSLHTPIKSLQIILN